METRVKHYTESIYYEMELTAKLMKMVAMQFFAKLNNGLVFDEYIVLDVIACNSGICQRDLAKLIIKDRANTGRIVGALEKKGLITRIADTKNNRLVRKLLLTDIGKKTIKNINELVKKRLNEASKVVSDKEIMNFKTNIKTFRTSLEKLIELKI